MSRLLRENVEHYKLIKRSFYFYDKAAFAWEICVRWTTDEKTGTRYRSPEFHKEIWADTLADLLLIVPRAHAKTTAKCKIDVLHSLLFAYEPHTLILSSESLGEETIGDIRVELETNAKIKAIWGNLVPKSDKRDFKVKKWRQKHLQLTNDMEVETIPKGGSVRGKRPTKIIVDDPQEDKDVKNPRIALEYWNWFWTSVYNLLMDGGKVCVLGTIISDNCFVNMLKQEADARGFKVIQYPAIIDFDEKTFTGRPLWPERWSMVALKARYEKIGREAFMQEYMHVPMVKNGSPVFSPEYQYKVLEPIRVEHDVHIYRELVEKTTDDKGNITIKPLFDGFIGIDLSFGRIGGDYTAITCRDVEGKLLASYRGYVAQDLACLKVDQMVKMLKSVKIIPENNNALAFLQACRAFIWYSNIYRKKILDKITNKESEVLGWSTNAKTKPMLINDFDQRLRSGEWEVFEELKQEILHYYYDEQGGTNAISPYHDDTVIADALCVQGIKAGVAGPKLLVL